MTHWAQAGSCWLAHYSPSASLEVRRPRFPAQCGPAHTGPHRATVSVPLVNLTKAPGWLKERQEAHQPLHAPDPTPLAATPASGGSGLALAGNTPRAAGLSCTPLPTQGASFLTLLSSWHSAPSKVLQRVLVYPPAKNKERAVSSEISSNLGPRQALRRRWRQELSHQKKNQSPFIEKIESIPQSFPR